MASPLSTVIVRQRTGVVPAETSHLGWELLIDGVLAGYYETKQDAENFAQAATFDGEG